MNDYLKFTIVISFYSVKFAFCLRFNYKQLVAWIPPERTAKDYLRRQPPSRVRASNSPILVINLKIFTNSISQNTSTSITSLPKKLNIFIFNNLIFLNKKLKLISSTVQPLQDSFSNKIVTNFSYNRTVYPELSDILFLIKHCYRFWIHRFKFFSTLFCRKSFHRFHIMFDFKKLKTKFKILDCNLHKQGNTRVEIYFNIFDFHIDCELIW